VLEPSERTAEVLFGLIMVLTFTGSLSVAEAGREDVRAMLIGALGCNLAWGVIDGVLYLMGALANRSRDLAVYCAVRDARDRARAVTMIADALPRIIADLLQPSELERVRQRLDELPAPPARARLTPSDCTARWRCACWYSRRPSPSRCRSCSRRTRRAPCAYPMPSPSRCSSSQASRMVNPSGDRRG
jgi:hypothetical protein